MAGPHKLPAVTDSHSSLKRGLKVARVTSYVQPCSNNLLQKKYCPYLCQGQLPRVGKIKAAEGY